MEKPLFICYAKCGTCQKAIKWLKANHIEVEIRDIIEQNPQIDELQKWLILSGLPVKKFFNTSGVRYKELNLKAVIPNSSQEELLALLASEGKLVKRPILVAGDTVLVGFKEEQYETLFK